MLNARLLTLVTLVACSSDLEQSSVDQAITGTPWCIDITTTGATPNDGTDDRVGIESAISAAVAPGGPHAICIPAGEFDVGRKPAVDGSIDISGLSDLAIYGTGPASVIAQYEVSPGHCFHLCTIVNPCTPNPNAWFLIWIRNGSKNIQIRDLTLKAVGINEFDEQTHLLRIGDGSPGSTDVLINNVNFEDSCGDGIEAVGTIGANGSALRVADSRFTGNHRRSITSNPGFNQIAVATTYFEAFSNTINVDEAGPSDISILGNLFHRPPGSSPVTSSYVATVGAATRVVVARNVLIDGGIDVEASAGVVIASNVVVGSTVNDKGDVTLFKSLSDVHVAGNVIIRRSSVSNPTIDVYAQSSAPISASVRDNAIIQNTTSAGIGFFSISRCEAINNSIFLTNAGSIEAGIHVEAISFPIDRVLLAENFVNGSAGGGNAANGIFLVTPSGSSGFSFNTIDVLSNVVVGASTGLGLGGTASKFLSIPTIAKNVWSGVTTDIDTAGLVPAYSIGGNRGGPQQFVGNGFPTISPPNGSIYLRRDGGTMSTLYVRVAPNWYPK